MEMSNVETTIYPAEAIYQAGIPMGMIFPVGNGRQCKMFIDSNLSADACSTYDIIIAAEDFEYTIRQFAENYIDNLPDCINVLLIYHYPLEQRYKTIAIKVILKRMRKPGDIFAGASYNLNDEVVLPFKEWTRQSIAPA